MNGSIGGILDQLAGQYKKGYRTSEFWVALLVGLVQMVAASFNPNQTLKAQLSNLTWVGISYILARTGLKVARLASSSRVISSVAGSSSQPQLMLADAAVASATAVAPAAAQLGKAYCWPLKPFDQMHPVRAYLNDPRMADGSRAFHFGLDISAPDGTAVYAVEDGTVDMEGAQNVAVIATDRARTFGYWHLVPAVKQSQRVHKGELLGHIAKGWEHVHFAERSAGEYINPLRSGGLAPFEDRRPPQVQRIVCSRGGQEIDPNKLSGAVDVIVEAFDRPPLPVPSPWADMPVTPARIRWCVTKGNHVVRPWHTPIDLSTKMLPQELFPVVYATGTRQNHPNAPGLFRFCIAHTWSTGLIADGGYRIEVEVSGIVHLMHGVRPMV